MYRKMSRNWPAPPSIHRGLEWPQVLNSLFDCLIVLCLIVCKFSHFSSPHLLFYSTVSSVLYWPAPPSIHRGLEWPQSLNRLFDCSLLVCVSANFLIFLLLILLFIVLSPLLLAHSPDDPQRIRVASVFEPFVLCLIVCLEANFLIFLLLTSSFIVLSPLLLACSP